MSAPKELRQLVHRLKTTEGPDRLLVLAELCNLAQRLSDEELLDLTQQPGGQSALARGLGITRQAMSQRVQHARQRIERTQQDAR